MKNSFSCYQHHMKVKMNSESDIIIKPTVEMNLSPMYVLESNLVVTVVVSRQLVECVFVEGFQMSDSSPTARDHDLHLVVARTERKIRS